MEEHSDRGYQTYCVITTNLDKKDQWTPNKVCIYLFKVPPTGE